jgi:Mycothiol maleylpyruvate isomerase N-terminal domain
MLLEVRTLAGRAIASRVQLDDLLDVVPAGHWQRSEPGAAWTARNHLEHLATVDRSLEADIERTREGDSWIGGSADAAAFRAARAEAIARLSDHKEGELRTLMQNARRGVTLALGRIGPNQLETRLFVPGMPDRWGQPASVSLREYLVSWANHDREHADAIRRAVTTPPDLSAAALAMSRRN